MSGFSSTPEWILAVGCPTCRAGAGSRCRRPSGHRCAPHRPRIDKAREAGEAPQADMGLRDHRAGEDRRQIKMDL